MGCCLGSIWASYQVQYHQSYFIQLNDPSRLYFLRPNYKALLLLISFFRQWNSFLPLSKQLQPNNYKGCKSNHYELQIIAWLKIRLFKTKIEITSTLNICMWLLKKKLHYQCFGKAGLSQCCGKRLIWRLSPIKAYRQAAVRFSASVFLVVLSSVIT